MDEKKAIDCLKNIIEYWTHKPTEVEAAKLAIDALEKQIPKISNCRLCNDTSNSRYFENKGYEHCPYCGQKLEY